MTYPYRNRARARSAAFLSGSALALVLALSPALADGGKGGNADYGDQANTEGGAGGVYGGDGANGSTRGGGGRNTGAGGGGGGAVDFSGAGGLGGNGAASGVGGSGGAGGAAGVGAGGAGGNGGDGIDYGVSASGGGGGGGGAAGIIGSSIIIGSNKTGGAGGNGGNGVYAATGDVTGAGGGGGAGGYGAILSGGGSVSAGVTLTGGAGGNGGSGAHSGSGGDGGIGALVTSGTVFFNSGTIMGGDGGAAGTPISDSLTGQCCTWASSGPGAVNGIAGKGGAGIVGTNLNIENSGSISGGMSGDGVTRANAVEFTGGANELLLHAGSSLTGNINIASGGDLVLATTAYTTLSSASLITGGGEVTFASVGGAFVLTGANTYTGATTLSNTSVYLSGDGDFAYSSGLTLDTNSTLDISQVNHDMTLASLKGDGSGAIFLGSHTLTLQSTGGAVFGDTLADGGAGLGTGAKLVVDGGLVSLAGNNTFTGGISIINLGTLEVLSDAAMGSGGAVTFSNGATLQLSGSVDYTHALVFESGANISVSSSVSGASISSLISDAPSSIGTLSLIGGGELALTNTSNSYTGGTFVYDGSTLILDSSGEIGSGSLTLGDSLDAGALRAGASFTLYNHLVIDNSNSSIDTDGYDLVLASGLDGTGTLNKVGAGSLTITSGNNSIAEIVADAGLLTVSDQASVTAGTLTLANGDVTVDGSDAELIVTGPTEVISTSTVSHPTLTVSNGGYLETQDTASLDGVASPFFYETPVAIVTGQNSYWYASGGLLIGRDFGPFESSGVVNVLDGGTLDTDAQVISIGSLGILNIGNGGLAGTVVAPQINNDGQIVADFTDVTTLAANLYGIGSLTKNGSGTLILTSGISTYSGGTFINAGTLQLGDGVSTGYISGTITNDANLAFHPADGSPLYFDSTIEGTGTVTLIGGELTLDNIANSYSGGTILNGGTLYVADDESLGDYTGGITFNGGTLQSLAPLTLDIARTITLGSGGGTLDVSGGGIDVQGDIHGTGGLAIRGGAFTANGGIYGGFSPAAILEGVNDFSGGLTVSDSLVLVLDQTGVGGPTGAITLKDNGALLFFGPTTLEAGRTITLEAGEYLLGGFDTLDIASRITGSGSLFLSGGDTITLSGANDYTGGTTIVGDVFISADNNLGAASAPLSLNSGILGFNADVTMTSRVVTLDGLGGAFDTNGHTVTIIKPITGSGDLIQTGAGTLILAGDSTNQGDTYIDGGTLVLGNGGAGGSLVNDASYVIFNGGTLKLNSSGSHTIVQDITDFAPDSGALVQAGSGTTILTGDNDYTGSTTISAGTLQVGNGGAIGTLGGTGAIANNGTLAFNRTGTVTLGRIVSGTGGISAGGVGILQLTQANTYTGVTSIASGGTLSLTGAGAITGSNVTANGTFNISGITASGTSITGLSGTGAVVLGAKTLTLSNPTGTFAGAISGTGGLVKNGSGTFFLTGTSSYTGPTSVNAGILSVNGTIASTVTLNGGTLKGSGTIGGLVTTSGTTIAPGNSIGTLNVAGNVTLASGSTFEVETDASGASDRINAAGTATINGGTVAVLAAPGAYAASTSYNIVTAGSVTGAFTNVTSNSVFLTPSLSYSASAVVLTLKPVPTFASLAATPNQGASANALQKGGTAGGTLFVSVFNLTLVADARAAFDAISGEIHASVMSAQAEDVRALRNGVLNRLRQTNAADEGWSLWGRVWGGWGVMNGDGNAAKAGRSSVGFTAGADTQIAANWRAGLEAGYGQDNLRLASRGSQASLTGGHVGAYATGQYDSVALRGGLMQGFGNSVTDRAIAFKGFSDNAHARQNASSTQAFGEVGYDIALDGATVEPFAGIAWTGLRAGAFSESGGSAALTGTAQHRDDLFSTLGLALSHSYALEDGAVLAPSLRAGWQHAFSNDPYARSLSFITSGQGFTVQGVPLTPDRAVIDAALSLKLPGADVQLGYAGVLSDRAADHGVRLGVSIAW